MLEKLTHAVFARHLNTHFQIQDAAAHSDALELVEAHAVPAPSGYEAFSIVFRGPPDRLLPQGIHRFRHDAIGAFDLFTVPIHQDQHGLYYEAVFTHRQEGQA